jgi:hypothetical protein
MKKYINAILTLSSVLVLFYIIYDQHKQINGYKEKLKLYDNMDMVMDSIKTESFQVHLMYDRYNIALEILREEDSVAVAKFERILENETE